MLRFLILTLGLSWPALSASFAQCEPCQQAAAERKRAAVVAARRQFQRLHPCPATANSTGPCPGWLIDHLIPPVCGGPESAANMFWQTVAEMAIKEREEIVVCRAKPDQRPLPKRRMPLPHGSSWAASDSKDLPRPPETLARKAKAPWGGTD